MVEIKFIRKKKVYAHYFVYMCIQQQRSLGNPKGNDLCAGCDRVKWGTG